MTTADWAAWVGALGGLLSVAATGYIAISERRRADRLEDSQENAEFAQRSAAIDEAQRLTQQIINKYRSLAGVETFENMPPYDINEYRDSIDVDRQHIASLQGFVGTSARLYIALGQLATACELPSAGIQTMDQHRLAAMLQAGLLKAKASELDELR